MKQAGAGTAFKYSAAHRVYIRAAKANRLANNANPFKAYRIGEVRPRVGDLVCKSRAGSGATYDNIQEDRPFQTHCDIVTAVNPTGWTTIGGNLSDSVGRTSVRLGTDGRPVDRQYFAIIRIG